jgi:hypothetical protein
MRILSFLWLSLILSTMTLSNAVASLKAVDTSALSHDVTDGIEALCIYQVRNGRTIVQVFSGNDLKTRSAIHVEGYISGVVLLSTNLIDASVAGRPLRTLQLDNDGSGGLAGYGNFDPEALRAAFHAAGQFDFDLNQMNRYRGKYAWFSNVPGEAICIQDQFNIVLNSSRQTLEVTVFHTGSTQLSAFSSKSESSGNKMNFRYFGNDPEIFKIPDFEVRVKAIADGIRSVESIVGNELVTSVNLLDFNGVNNALTSDGSTEIWIYPDIFWNESLEELHTIARHETLHILVDQGRLTKNADLRELFADLRDLDIFSLERFALMTTGVLPPGTAQKDNKRSDHILFAFINEMNFFKGMKGGHSRDNLEEFCVSFLHTLLYPENLYRNLRSPLILPGAKAHMLSPKDQASLLKDYLLVIEKMIGATGINASGKITKTFLMDRLEKTKQLKARII